MTKFTSISNSRPMLVFYLQIAAMSAIGIGQPILQLVRENPEFLVVHHSQTLDVLLLAAALFFLLPAALWAVVYLAGLVREKLSLLIHSLILGGLLFLILLPVVDKILVVNSWLDLALVAAPAAAMAYYYRLSRFLQQNLAFLALGLPVFLFLFLGSGPIMGIMIPGPAPESSPGQAVDNPVVMIIFDELPTSSLMGMDQELDCQLFPNFCRLAEKSNWYRNATSISGATLRAVPTIMSGNFPVWSETPSLADHPQNIFTLLGASHQVSSLETQTSLCPDELKSEPIPELIERLNLLYTDLTILYEHIVVPEYWRHRLIPVSNKWGEFRGSGGGAKNGGGPVTKIEQFEKFISSVELGGKPNLVVAHILLPHNPYKFFPNGKIYNWRNKVPVSADGTWGPDQVLMAHSYRRHILQVVAVDRLLGDLLDRLEELNIFDNTAIVITADHGASFRTGLDHRRFNDGNEADIMSVPLFIKFPGQSTGAIDDRFVQTIDILPTLVSALEIQSDWTFDGHDLLSTTTPERNELDFFDQDKRVERKIAPTKLKERNEIIRWKHDLFGDDGGFERLFTFGDNEGLLGKDVAELQFRDHPTLHGEILEANKLDEVDLDGMFVPTEINGTLDGHDGNGRLTLALALNGKIAGISETYLDGPNPNRFNWQIMTHLEIFRNGSNKVELFLVTKAHEGPDLLRVPLMTSSFLGKNLGSLPVTGIKEKGLLKPHDWGGRMARWTTGKARWEIPLKKGENPKILTIGIVSSGPQGADLSVSVNGTRLLSQVLPHGGWETRIPLNSIKSKNSLTVEIKSSVFVPSESNPQSTDNRKLGVAVTTLVAE